MARWFSRLRAYVDPLASGGDIERADWGRGGEASGTTLRGGPAGPTGPVVPSAEVDSASCPKLDPMVRLDRALRHLAGNMRMAPSHRAGSRGLRDSAFSSELGSVPIDSGRGSMTASGSNLEDEVGRQRRGRRRQDVQAILQRVREGVRSGSR